MVFVIFLYSLLIYTNYDLQKGVFFEVEYKEKTFDADDTTTQIIINGFKYDEISNKWSFYHEDQKQTIYYENNTGYYWFHLNRSFREIDGFLRASNFKRFTMNSMDPLIKGSFQIDTLSFNNHYIVTFYIKDDGVSTNDVRKLYFRYGEFHPFKYEWSIELYGQIQFKSWEIISQIEDEDYLFDFNHFKGFYSNYTEHIPEEASSEIELLHLNAKFPEIGFKDLDENLFQLNNFESKPTFIYFWYTRCLPCIEAIPQLNEFYQAYGDRINFIAINVYPESRERMDRFMNHTKIQYPIYNALSREINKELKLIAYPTLYLLDEKGKIIHADFGYLKGEQNSFIQLMDKYFR